MMSLWDALRMNMMISYQELVRTFLRYLLLIICSCFVISDAEGWEYTKDVCETCVDFLKQYDDLGHGTPVYNTIAEFYSVSVLLTGYVMLFFRL